MIDKACKWSNILKGVMYCQQIKAVELGGSGVLNGEPL